MSVLLSQVQEALAYIQDRDSRRPEVGIILGSGLGQLAEVTEDATRMPFATVPGFPRASVKGHAGELIVGDLSGRIAAILNGRIHFYEGHDPAQVTFPVRVLHGLGCRTLIVTNAAGGLNPHFKAGDLMLIEDHINLVALSGSNPLRGVMDSEFGPAFVNMSQAYDAELREQAFAVAERLGQNLKRGVYAMVAGPSFETPAEIRFLRAVGADAVGMSTASEVIVARHCGMRVLGISCIANMAIGEEHLHLSHQEVLAATKKAGAQMARLIASLVEVV